jgi:regulator of protease activity HflC (stomatin/prohibitin superfamily)
MTSRVALVTALAASACASQDVPQAYRGRMFDRTGLLALYAGGHGFSGPILGPGTYFTGIYDEVRMVDCSMVTMREPLTSLTKDGVQFGLDIYVRFSADCSDTSVDTLLRQLTPDHYDTITSKKIYDTYVRPAVGEAVREVVSPIRANDLNDRREELLSNIRKRFMEIMEIREHKVVIVHEVNLSNLDFPDAMDAANVERAVQAILKDKAIAERERVTAEIETMAMRRKLAEAEGDMAAAKIERIGAALRRYAEYLQWDLQNKMPEIYRTAGAAGNLIIAAPNVVSAPRVNGPLPPPAAVHDNPPAQRSNPLDPHDNRQAQKDP